MSRDEEAEPTTRVLGTIARSPTADETRLEVALPKLSATEPVTKILHRSALPSSPALGATALPVTASSRSHAAISGAAGRRRMPLVLALLLAAMCIAAGASLLRPRSRRTKPASAPPAASERTAPSHAAPGGSAVTAVTRAPAAQPEHAPSLPNAPRRAGVE